MEAKLEQLDELSLVAKNLWPQHPLNEIRNVLERYIKEDETSVFEYSIDNKIVGLALASLRRDYVEGCGVYPVGYLEGICVEEQYRKTGIATKLCKECEEWAKSKGSKEFASDCLLTNEASHKFHLSIGFEEVNTIIHFKKNL